MNFFLLTIEQCNPPHRVSRIDHVEDLMDSLLFRGWYGTALLGYYDGPKYQLLSGSHRYAAALRLGCGRIPVTLLDPDAVTAVFGNLRDADNFRNRMGGRIISVRYLPSMEKYLYITANNKKISRRNGFPCGTLFARSVYCRE